MRKKLFREQIKIFSFFISRAGERKRASRIARLLDYMFTSLEAIGRLGTGGARDKKNDFFLKKDVFLLVVQEYFCTFVAD
ncbi:MAG: hypothetical protein J6T94_05905 [Bacteroidaceae bacterium]|nr:hypothetical protein [Bacteroidaceae bacterium]